jgi:predicted alpha/beta hydrolase
VGQKKLGHFGFFREKARETLWREAAEWLLSAARGSVRSPG